MKDTTNKNNLREKQEKAVGLVKAIYMPNIARMVVWHFLTDFISYCYLISPYH